MWLSDVAGKPLTPLAMINFRFNPIAQNLSEEQLALINQGIVKKITAARKAILATTVLQEKVVIRMCLINPRTTLEDIEYTPELCHIFAEEVLSSP